MDGKIMKGKSVVILGGGVGGIVAANELVKLIPADNTITVIERNEMHSFAPSYLWMMNGDRSADDVSIPLRKLLSRRIELIHDEILSIDTNHREVKTNRSEIPYDFLVVALGAEYETGSIKGLNDDSLTFYTKSGAQILHSKLAAFRSGKIALVICSLPYKCPAAPHEAALLIDDFFTKKGIRNQVEIDLYTPEPMPMPVGGPVLGASVRNMLQSRNIGYLPFHKLNEVDGINSVLQFENDKSYSYDLLIIVPPHRTPGVVSKSGLANESGWIPVDQLTLQTEIQNVYAIGDVASIALPGRWNPDVQMMLPKAGVFAHSQGEVVAQRIANSISNRTAQAVFNGFGYCLIESGDGQAGFAIGDFFATPNPLLSLRDVQKKWHLGKVLFEKWWLAPIGFKKFILKTILAFGMRFLNVHK